MESAPSTLSAKRWIILPPIGHLAILALGALMSCGPLALGLTIESLGNTRLVMGAMLLMLVFCVALMAFPARGVWAGRLHTGWLLPSYPAGEFMVHAVSGRGASIGIKRAGVMVREEWTGLVLS